MAAVPKISGAEAYELMKTVSDNEETIRYHLRSSALEKAIYGHADSNDCVLFKFPKHYDSIVVHRGTGKAISITDYRRYWPSYESNPAGGSTVIEPENFGITVQVDFWSEEYQEEKQVHFELSPPVSLLTDFSSEKFDEWIAKLRKERNTAQTKTDLETLRALIRLYPSHAQEILEEKS